MTSSEFLVESAACVAGSAGFWLADRLAIRKSAEKQRIFSDIHVKATDEFIEKNPNVKIKQHTLSKFIGRGIMAGAGVVFGLGIANTAYGTIKVAPPRKTPELIIDGTMSVLSDNTYGKVTSFADKAFSSHRQVNGIIAESNHQQALSSVNSNVLNKFSGFIGGKDGELATATLNTLNAAGNSTSEGPIVVLSDGVGIGSPAEISNQEKSQRSVPIYVVDEKNCAVNQLDAVANATGGQCWPMNNPGTVAKVDAVINTKINSHTIPSGNIDWSWLSLSGIGLAIGAAGYFTRKTGVLPHFNNAIGE